MLPLFAATDGPAGLTAERMQALLKAQEAARWSGEWAYFRELHDLLPEPFFQTQGFLLFLLAVGIAYWMVPRCWNTARVVLLLVASFHFYAAWNAGLAFLVLVTATLDYLLARGIDAAKK